LELWLSRFLGGEVSITGAGRTDAGVHALDMPAHFDWPEPLDAPALHHRLKVAIPADSEPPLQLPDPAWLVAI
jgi:tRNA pseudouridine38-40 synthase